MLKTLNLLLTYLAEKCYVYKKKSIELWLFNTKQHNKGIISIS